MRQALIVCFPFSSLWDFCACWRGRIARSVQCVHLLCTVTRVIVICWYHGIVLYWSHCVPGWRPVGKFLSFLVRRLMYNSIVFAIVLCLSALDPGCTLARSVCISVPVCGLRCSRNGIKCVDFFCNYIDFGA